MHKREHFFYIGIFTFFILVQLLYMIFSFPLVKITASSSNTQESFSLFYKEKNSVFDDTNVSSNTISTPDKRVYYFKISPQTNALRIDPGTSIGTTKIYNIVVFHSLFEKTPLDINDVSDYIYSADIGNAEITEDALVLESIGQDPFLVITEIDSNSTFDISGFVKLGFIIINSLLTVLAINRLIFYVNKLYMHKNKIIPQVQTFFIANKHTIKGIGFLLFVALFFSLPVIFSYDSGTYLTYLDIFSGDLRLSQWGKTRGWGFPLFLWISTLLFGKTGYGMNVALFIIYAIYLFYLLKTFRKLWNGTNKFLTLFLFCLFIILNPIILGYYHIILTEPLAATLCCLFTYQLITIHQNESCNKTDTKNIFTKILLTALNCTLLYFVKQMFFVIPLIMFVLSELTLCFYRKKKMVHLALGIICTLLMLLTSTKIWNTSISADATDAEQQADTNAVMEQLDQSSSDMLTGYLKKGAIYFQEEEGENLNSISYLLKCLTSHPSLLLQGYIDNYLALSNIYTLEVPEDYCMSDAAIIKEVSFIRGLENTALAQYPRYYKQIENTYTELGTHDSLIPYGEYVDENIVTKTLYSAPIISCSNFMYSLSILYAPISMLLHTVLLFFERKKENTNRNSYMLILSGTVFLYGLALCMLCMRIDRYMFPVLAMGLLVVLSDIKSFIQYSFLIIRKYHRKEC